MRRSLGVAIELFTLLTRPAQIQRSGQEKKALLQELKYLRLYDYAGCPSSRTVRHTLHRLNLNIQYCDIRKCQVHSDDLLAQHGQLRAPCLRIESVNGVQWLDQPEAIVDFLVNRFDPTFSQQAVA